jgi:hypothetical protein
LKQSEVWVQVTTHQLGHQIFVGIPYPIKLAGTQYNRPHLGYLLCMIIVYTSAVMKFYRTDCETTSGKLQVIDSQ